MPTQVAPLGLRCFLEGIEIPVIAAQVVSQPSQPAAASIQIVPTDTALLFLPRTLVHLFYLDEELTADDRALADKFDENKVDRFDVEDERYRLFYAGEVTGMRYVKTPSSRSIILQCMDLSSYWDTCYQWFADYSVGGSGLTDMTHNFIGAGQGLFNNVASGTRWVIGNLITTAPANPEYQGVRGLLAGYIHVLESIGGLRPKGGGDGYDGKRGVNDFFTIAELRYNLTGMIGAVAKDTTSGRMFAHKAFLNWLEQGMGSAGSLISYRDVIKLIGQYIFHDVYPNPSARLIRGGKKKKIDVLRSHKVGAGGPKLVKYIISALNKLTGARTALRTLEATPGSNSGAVKWEEGLGAVVKAGRELEAAKLLLKQSRAANAPAARLKIEHVTNSLQTFVNRFVRTAQRPEVGGILDTEVSKSLSLQLTPLIADLEKVLKVKTIRKTVKVEVTTSDHLFNQLILPETFFVSPPKCNVIFPDQVEQFQWTRNFMREVTRLSCQGGIGIISRNRAFSKILGRHYFAPNIKDARGEWARKTIYSSGTTILPHEIHSGIIPKMEHITQGHRWGIKAAKQGKKTIKKIREAKISYIQRLANFQFFIHRWQARTMVAKLRFSPQLVLGFPGVVIDRAAPSPGAIEVMSDLLGTGRAILPTAYIGKIANISHDLNQGGGSTNVSFSHARTHRGIDDEFLGVLERERKDFATREIVLIVESMIAATRSAGGIKEETDLLRRAVAGTLKPGLRLDSGERVASVDDSGPTTEISFQDLRNLGVTQDALNRLKDVQDNQAVFTGAGKGLFGSESFISGRVAVPKTIKVTVESKTNLGKFVSPEGAPAPEVILKPGWYSNVWNPDEISEAVYAPLLGTLAITDDETVTSPEGFRSLVDQLFRAYGFDTVMVAIEGEDKGVTVEVNGQSLVAFDLSASNVERAIDGLTLLYAQVKKQNLNAQEFIRAYTRRPIATLPEILGSKDLQFNPDGTVKDPSTMIEGFHSRAFGPYNVDVKQRNDTGEESSEPVAGKDAMFLLIPDGKGGLSFNRSIVDKGTELGDIAAHLDPRGRAQQRVLAYVAELKVSRGLLAT